MKQFIVVIIIYLVAILLAKLLAVGLFLVFLYLKKIIQNMDEGKWMNYFKIISNKGLLYRFFIFYVISLFTISALVYFISYELGYNYSINLSWFLIMIGSIYILLKYRKNKDSILDKLNRIKRNEFI